MLQPHAPNPVRSAGDEVHAANRETEQTMSDPDAYIIQPVI